MDKIFMKIERRMGAVMIALGVTAVVLGTINWLWHLWMIGAMFITLGRELKR